MEFPQGEALDVRIGNVEPDIVDAFIEPEVLERREFHGAAIVRAEIKFMPSLSMWIDKKRGGPPSERPTGVRVVGDSEGIRPLGPELEDEAPARLGMHFYQKAVLRRASVRH